MNKILIVAALAFLVSLNGYSQTFISGNLGFKHTNSKISDNYTKESNIVINPIIGGFISNKFAIGTDFSIMSSMNKQEINSTALYGYPRNEEIKAKQYYIGVFARLYSPISEKIKFIFHLSNGIIDGKTSYEEEYTVSEYEYDWDGIYHNTTTYKSSYELETSGYRAYFKPGLSVNVSKHWDIELFLSKLSYHHLKNNNKDFTTSQAEQDDIEFSFNDISFGATFIF